MLSLHDGVNDEFRGEDELLGAQHVGHEVHILLTRDYDVTHVPSLNGYVVHCVLRRGVYLPKYDIFALHHFPK